MEKHEMTHLKKANFTVWHGNGLGTTTAEWTVKGCEHIAVRQLGTTWVATDTSTGVRIAVAYTRKTLIEKLDEINL
jgi:hypothetical protein